MKLYVLRFASMASVLVAGFSLEPTRTDAAWFSCTPINNQANTSRTRCYEEAREFSTHPTILAAYRAGCNETHRNRMVEYNKCVADPRGYYGFRFLEQYLAEVQEYHDECAERAMELR